MNTFTIKDLENLSGIKAHTIRIWEQRYHFLKPQRTDTNIRYYSNHELKTLLNIALLNKYGYKISHIDKIEEQELQNKIIALSGMEAYQDRLVNDLIHCMIELDVDKFENLLDCFIISKGIEKSITQIIFPFMERIGILWMTNHIHPVQEHLVTNIIRQKLMVGIEGIVNHVAVDKTILLFLPENEHHELGLLFAHYLFRKRGAKVLYLGASVPVKDLEYLCLQKKPDYLYTHLTCMPGSLNFERFIAFKNQALKHIPLILSGQLAMAHINKPIPSVHFKKSLAEVQEFIAML